ncbi:hypothetical protein EMIHUDRAFT_108849 [Emiliania huxleyi CCMP1516]|uniref:CS domain-containing protein n=2 Tax=Emiliania huxleyi TaxID=2903 RepID=A0A0D3KVT9_EMIH1|nr:hypothetical protein EMIHUDRAFT_108849 [Emiliania huxleyi CCMP1516]EOD39874.1 hypothetical protein EMIHUDRAFT_108849 [Emiliania huxleyi CCMP1516]|eukprot:XP_005792303.1 hypothetical protein EMIHUDRAFT_108849 [Emiliania huxleyi CCMP1516]
MAASSDLQALQLQNRNLQQKLDWKQLKINQRDKHIRDLRDATPARAADLERLERSLCRLSLQMEHMQLVIKKPEWSFHTFAMPEKTASSAHTIFVRPPSGNRLEVTIPPGKLPGDIFTVMLKDEDAYPPDWVWHAAPPAAPAHSAPPPWAEEQPAAQEGEDGEEGADEEDADEAALRKKAPMPVGHTDPRCGPQPPWVQQRELVCIRAPRACRWMALTRPEQLRSGGSLCLDE